MKSLVFILLLPCLVADPLRFVPRRPTADWSTEVVNGNRTDEPVVCPGKHKFCPEHQTCCRSYSDHDDYSCCPMSDAVCCNDYRHCCPRGYRCDLEHESCMKEEELSVPVVKTELAQNKELTTVLCPGSAFQCPDGTTCCKLKSETFGCCPIPSAICCPNGVNCCPQDYKCGDSGCHKGSLTIPFSFKTPAVATGISEERPLEGLTRLFPELESVRCADGNLCPSRTTCCKLTSGKYGCCPLDGATCCKDGVHCCPRTYVCDDQRAECRKGLETIPWVEKIESTQPTRKDLVDVADVMCPDHTSCPRGSTRCKSRYPGYSCCPIPSAVCCNDGLHCCRFGYTCDMKRGTCTKQENGIITEVPLIPKHSTVKNIICPDDVTECSSMNTCCLLHDQQWGCCPLTKAVCCSDHVHCCAEGFTCDIPNQSCDNGFRKLPLVKKVRGMRRSDTRLMFGSDTSRKSVICPDQESECSDGQTCCLTKKGTYACCPFAKETCCNDGVHCCPAEYNCDLKAGTCTHSRIHPFSPASRIKEPEKSTEADAVICPDQQSQCPEGNTCCKLNSGEYGCCPLPKADCCRDHVHCCPNGYTCDTGAGTCNKGLEIIPFFRKTEATKVQTKTVTSVICPDQQSQCPDGNTCCKLESDGYACCPLPKATCCQDHVHCCPNGYTCAAGTCNKGLERIPFYAKEEASKVQTKTVTSVICPDQQSQCPEGNTCCKLNSGEYGCCPLPKADCCRDHVHCCPNGYTCDTGAGTCNKGLEIIPFFRKTEATKVQTKTVTSVICPDQQSQCPDGNTCCKLESDGYACCPLPKATCCQDHVHCCPNGYTCDTGAGTCNKGLERIPFYTKSNSDKKVGKIDGVMQNTVGTASPQLDVLCPGERASCPTNTTCCLMSDGQYGCCPMANAVCCPDHLHCCPEMYTCNVARGTCMKGKSTLPLQRKVLAEQSGVTVHCKDGGSCPDNYTCCPIGGSVYGCCTYSQAVCCPDQKHCCPHLTTCVGQGTTLKCKPSPTELVSGFIQRLRPLNVKPRPIQNKPRPNTEWTPVIGQGQITCPDGRSWCNDWETCCSIGQGQYGCCPYEKGVCCSDHVHCCPGGYNCTDSQCVKGPSQRPLSVPRRADAPEFREPSVEAVDCGKGVTCPEGTTCCDMITGEPGCCPVPNASCCDDKLHCCSAGLICDETGNKCSKPDGSLTIDALAKFPARKSDTTFP